MTILSKFALAAGLAAIAVASPVFAQSFDPDLGTGNLAPFQYATTATPHAGTVRSRGIDAFAMVPRAESSLDPSDPALTGGGSLGYNRMLQVY